MRMIIDAAAFTTVLLAALYLIVLGIGAMVMSARTKQFLNAFASTARVHFLELWLRLLVGGAFVLRAPQMQYRHVFVVIGWILVGTTLILALIPWRRHREFAMWAVPQATRFMLLLGLGSLAGGLLLLRALVSYP